MRRAHSVPTCRGLLETSRLAWAVDEEIIQGRPKPIYRLDSQQAEDYVSLKKQLDTVAVLTDAGLRRTENQVVELAGMTTPSETPRTGRPNTN